MSDLLTRLHKLRDKGTQGEWFQHEGVISNDLPSGLPTHPFCEINHKDFNTPYMSQDINDAELIVGVVNALPKLLEVIRVQGEVLKSVSQQADKRGFTFEATMAQSALKRVEELMGLEHE